MAQRNILYIERYTRHASQYIACQMEVAASRYRPLFSGCGGLL